MAAKVPPPVNDQAHRAFIAELRQMSPAQIVRTAQKAGIYDQNGNLTAKYGGESTKPAK